MKIIYISSNLDQQIENVLNKICDVKISSINEPIEHIDAQEIKYMCDNKKPVRVVVDLSCFYSEDIALKYLEQIAIHVKHKNIIVIYFSKELSYDLLKIGIYNLIDFNRKMNLHDELINLIKNPNKEMDEKILEDSGLKLKLPKIIAGVGFHSAVFQTSYWLTYLKCDGNKKKCLIELRKDKQLEVFYDEKIDKESKIAKYSNENSDVVFSISNFDEKQLKRLLFSIAKDYDEIILDVSYNMLSLTPYIFTIANEIFIFRRECLFERSNSSLQEKTRLLLKDVRIKKVFESDHYKTTDVFYTLEDIIDFYKEEVEIDFMIFEDEIGKFSKIKSFFTSDIKFFRSKKKKSSDLLLS